MNEEQYQQEMSIAQKYAEQGDFKEAESYYRKALRSAPPAELQATIERIREMKGKAATTPKKDETVQQREELGFTVYDKKFSDVMGYERQKKLVKRWIELPMKQGGLFTHFKMAKSTGIIMYGPPGTGKTLFTKALSGEFKLPMRDININDILGHRVGDSENNMAKAFEDAKQCQPALLFFDELDALGASRENASADTANDIKNTINVFMKEISELHDNKEMRVFVVGATNLPWLVDDAIKRSGRLEHFVYMSPPSMFDRKKLFDYYLQMESFKAWCESKGANKQAITLNKPYMHEEHTKYLNQSGHKINTLWLAIATVRYSQADIEKICTAAKRRAIEGGRAYLTTKDIQNVLRDKNEGTSSLDSWVLKASKTYIKSSKTVVHRTGILGWRKQKEKVEEQGKLTDGELKIYKPLISNIKSNMRWWLVANAIRFIAQGI